MLLFPKNRIRKNEDGFIAEVRRWFSWYAINKHLLEAYSSSELADDFPHVYTHDKHEDAMSLIIKYDRQEHGDREIVIII